MKAGPLFYSLDLRYNYARRGQIAVAHNYPESHAERIVRVPGPRGHMWVLITPCNVLEN